MHTISNTIKIKNTDYKINSNIPNSKERKLKNIENKSCKRYESVLSKHVGPFTFINTKVTFAALQESTFLHR